MGRAGYTEDIDSAEDQWALICWRGAVASAIRGKRGQAFLREMLAALDALPEKRLIAEDLVVTDAILPETNGCCAIGAVALQRGTDVQGVDPYDRERVAELFGIAEAMAAEIVWVNDEAGRYRETPEQRYTRVRGWVERKIRT